MSARITSVSIDSSTTDKFIKEQSRDITKFGVIITSMVVFFLGVTFLL